MRRFLLVPAVAVVSLLTSCSAAYHHRKADETAAGIIAAKQQEALGRTEPFTIEPPSDALRRRLLLGQELPCSGPLSLGAEFAEPVAHFPEPDYLAARARAAAPPWEGERPYRIDLDEALRIAARNSREYQNEKEGVFRSALALDLERNQFRSIFAATTSGEYTYEPRGSAEDLRGVRGTGNLSLDQLFANGIQLTTLIGLDLVKLLTLDRTSSLGQFGDATVSIPLWRGSGSHVVGEPLEQAERDVLYAIWGFERYKRTFAVRVASEYLAVLQQLDQVQNAEQNYRGLIASTRRARRLAQAGRLPGIDVGEAIQDELTARNRWISSQQSYRRRLDGFKLLLGLPPDADLDLDPGALQDLVRRAEPLTRADSEARTEVEGEVPPADAPIELAAPTREGGGPLEMEPERAIRIALRKRLDLRVATERVYDAERRVAVAADRLRGELTLLGSASVGERRSLGLSGLPDTELDFGGGSYSALLTLDLPIERTAERVRYRQSLIDLEKSVRDLQALEDGLKLDVQNALRDLLEARATVQIQAQALQVAEHRVEATGIFLEAGRAQIRDLLLAQNSLISAQNALTAALVGYRVAELELQRDLGVLQVDGTVDGVRAPDGGRPWRELAS